METNEQKEINRIAYKLSTARLDIDLLAKNLGPDEVKQIFIVADKLLSIETELFKISGFEPKTKTFNPITLFINDVILQDLDLQALPVEITSSNPVVLDVRILSQNGVELIKSKRLLITNKTVFIRDISINIQTTAKL